MPSVLSKEAIWKEIPNYEEYEVSNCGYIKGKTGSLMKPCLNRDGYFYFCVNKNKKQKTMKVHRLVAELFSLKRRNDQNLVDHKDGNKLNNHVNNIRWCNRSEQNYNRRIFKSNQLGFKGVYFNKRNKKNPYQAHININGKFVSLGYFPELELASQAYKKKAREIHGEFYKE